MLLPGGKWPLRIRKALDFVRNDVNQPIEITPHPWSKSRPTAAYYLVRQRHENDGRAGYTNRYAFDRGGLPFRLSGAGKVYSALVLARYGMEMLHFHGPNWSSAERPAIQEALLRSARGRAVWGVGPSPDLMCAEHPSAMVQGVVISALIRLANGAPDSDTVAVIDNALWWMLRPVDSSGTVSRLNGEPFLEEFPRLPAGHILNGCIYGLLGLYDAADVLGHPSAAVAAERVQDSLRRSIHLFDAHFGWSYYALHVFGRRYLASMHYHRSHISMVKLLEARCPDTAFTAAARRWQAAMVKPEMRVPAGVLKMSQTVWARVVRRLPLAEH